MAKLSKHFSQSEFECKCGCGCEVIVSHELLDLLKNMRYALGEGILVTSGARCKKHNDAVGGTLHSWHIPRNHNLYAADITFLNPDRRGPMDILELYVLADRWQAAGIGLYDGRIHVDQRPSKTLHPKRARWVHTSWKWDNGS